MSISRIIHKCFTGGQWYIAYRKKDSDIFYIADTPTDQWCADPFVFENDGVHYIFVEQYNKDKEKGCIGYFQFEKGVPVNKGTIIENTYHMSYPNVFEYNNKFYMVPESSANNTVDIYVAEEFPFCWRKVSSLISGKKYVDSTIYNDGNDFYLITYSIDNGFEINVFKFDVDRMRLNLISKKSYNTNVARPAGRLFFENGVLMRPAQDCSISYGKEIIIYQVDSINSDGEFIEHEVRRVGVDSIAIENKPDRVHHYTCDDTYEVFDVFREKFDLFHLPRILIRSLKS